MTVSRALRGVEGVSERKRTEILKLARQMKYVPNSNARSLVVSNSNLIGISFPTFAAEVFAEILNGMRGTFDTAGYSSVIDTTDYSRTAELSWVKRLLSWQPAAIILTGIDHDNQTRELLRASKIPVLEIWDHTDDPIDACVGIDHFAAGQLIGQHAFELGYKAPAFVTTPSGHDIRADARREGVRSVYAGTDVRTSRPPLDNAFLTGFVGTESLIADKSPDVIFYLNDHMAFGGLMACRKLGLSVPDQIGIIGFNGLDIIDVLPVKLTTVKTPRKTMGILGARAILARIHGIPAVPPQALPVEFVPGETTRQQPPVQL
jgi:LacI family gluconate utilization system Gnt-I transcriptional repressor